MSDDTPDAAPKKPRSTRSASAATAHDSSDVTAATDSTQASDPTPADVAVEAEESSLVSETIAEPEPVLATSDPASVDTGEVEPTQQYQPAQQVVYVTAPVAPRAQGNRGIGSLYAVVSAIVFAALLAIATAIIGTTRGAPLNFGFLAEARFYIPVLFFVIGFVLLVLILNRAAWWAYVVGSILLAVFVYFGTIGVGLLGNGIILNTPSEAAAQYGAALRDPFIIVSALLAREVSMWTGALIAARGRKVKARNLQARTEYERELAEKRADHERRVAGAPAAL